MATDKTDDPKKAVETKEPATGTEETEDKVKLEEPEEKEKEAKPAAEKPEPEEPAKEEDSDPDHLVTPSRKEGSSVKGLVVVIIIAVVIVFGTGGFLAWKYLLKDKFSKKGDSSGKVTNSDTTTSPAASSATSPSATTPASGAGTGLASSTSSTKDVIIGDYVIADSNTRVISRAELTSLTPWQLKVARNEIYARHGREFVHKDLQCYFATKTWYSVNPAFSETDLSTTENQNIATVQAYEKEISSSLASQDSGC